MQQHNVESLFELFLVDRAIKFIFRSAALYFVIGLTNVLACGFMCSCKKQNDQLLAVKAEPEQQLEANKIEKLITEKTIKDKNDEKEKQIEKRGNNF